MASRPSPTAQTSLTQNWPDHRAVQPLSVPRSLRAAGQRQRQGQDRRAGQVLARQLHGAGPARCQLRRSERHAGRALPRSTARSCRPPCRDDRRAAGGRLLSAAGGAVGALREAQRAGLVDGARAISANEDGNYTYSSFDYAKPGKMIAAGGGATNTASITIRGGRLVTADPGHEVYEFQKGPWTYRVSASADNTTPGAKLTVLRDGKTIQSSVATAYQMAAKRIE